MKAYAILLCGGSGTRMGGRDNKTLLKIGGVPAIVKAFRAFETETSGQVLVDRDYEVAANSKTQLGTIPFSGQGLIEIEYSADGETHRNHFLYGQPPFKWAEVKEWMKDTVIWRHE